MGKQQDQWIEGPRRVIGNWRERAEKIVVVVRKGMVIGNARSGNGHGERWLR